MRGCKNIVMLTIMLCMNGSVCGAAVDGWENLARTPPMGWNSWNTFRLEINEDLVRGIAEMFVERGFKNAGYEYIVIDDR
jgi:alpha-galactosidase